MDGEPAEAVPPELFLAVTLGDLDEAEAVAR